MLLDFACNILGDLPDHARETSETHSRLVLLLWAQGTALTAEAALGRFSAKHINWWSTDMQSRMLPRLLQDKLQWSLSSLANGCDIRDQQRDVLVPGSKEYGVGERCCKEASCRIITGGRFVSPGSSSV